MGNDFNQDEASANEPFVQSADEKHTSEKLPGQTVWPPQENAQGQQPQAQGGNASNPLHGQLQGVREQVENQIEKAIDHYAGQIPGGQQFTPQAKQAVDGILDGLQKQLEDEAAKRLGGLGGLGGFPGFGGGNNGGLLGNDEEKRQ